MPELLKVGGVVMWIILACSVVAVAVALERLFHLHRAQIHAEDFMKGIRNLLKRGNASEALAICQETPGPVAHLLEAALLKIGGKREAMREAIEHAGVKEVPRLERNLSILATLAQVTPLLGLFGTVLGFIQVFQQLSHQSGIQLGDLSAGVMRALICTAAGLGAAIFCYVAHNYLAARVHSIISDMEEYSGEILSLLTEPQKMELSGEAAVTEGASVS
jgi:biopolymer transport protein ExbB